MGTPGPKLTFPEAVRCCAEVGALVCTLSPPVYDPDVDDEAAAAILAGDDDDGYEPAFRDAILAHARQLIQSGQCPELVECFAIKNSRAA